MFEFEYPALPSAEAYLKRMHYTGDTAPTLENLHALIRTHQMNVPFENLDCCLTKVPVSLDVDHLYEKFVTRKRGGYCFECNTLFMTLLRALGYDATLCLSRVASICDQLRPVKHCAIVVALEGKRYFCDVGFGGAMAPFAVEISPEYQTRDGETYWVEETERGWYLVRRLSGKGLQDDGSVSGTVKNVAIFGTLPVLIGDLEAYSYQCWAMPGSPFIGAPSVAIRTEDGYVNLKGDTLYTRAGDTLTAEKVSSEELPAVLKDSFGIVL